MNDELRRKFNVGHTVLEGLDNHDYLWSAITIAVSKRDLLASQISDVNNADSTMVDTSGTGFHDNKLILKHDLADLADIVGKAVCAYSLDQNDLNTFSIYHHNAPYLLHLNDEDLVSYSNSLFGFASPITATLLTYNLPPGQVTNLNAKKVEFVSFQAKPRENISDHKAAGQLVVAGLTAMNTTLHWWETFFGTFRLTNPGEYSAFKGWMTKVDTGVRHMSMHGKITGAATGGVLYRAKITITNLPVPRSTFTTVTGEFSFFSLNPGEYDIKVELDGYQPFIQTNILIEEGKITTRNISLVRI